MRGEDAPAVADEISADTRPYLVGFFCKSELLQDVPAVVPKSDEIALLFPVPGFFRKLVLNI